MYSTELAAGQAEAVVRSLGLTGTCDITVTAVAGGPSRPPGAGATGAYASRLDLGPTGEPALDAGTYVWVRREEDTTRIHLMPDMDPVEGLVHLADGLQDWAIELTHGQPLPPCPDHPHPMRATILAGAAVWACPKGPAVVPIG